MTRVVGTHHAIFAKVSSPREFVQRSLYGTARNTRRTRIEYILYTKVSRLDAVAWCIEKIFCVWWCLRIFNTIVLSRDATGMV